MIILAIDTSCDDTCISIIKVKSSEILANIISSQIKLHAKYGGVWPFLAKREHQKNLPIIFEEALQRAKNPKVDLIAVTVGPGLEPCLWIGVNFAKNLAKNWTLPLIPINHVEAHIFANFVGLNSRLKTHISTLFPAVCLVASGGHTQLILMRDFGKYKSLGETRDDAAGECFDKVARILGLGYPGGPSIETEAKKIDNLSHKLKIKLPRPMIYQKNYDFSFAGLKTAVFYNFRDQPKEIRKSKIYIREMAKEVQDAIIDVLISKTLRATKEYKAKSIILGGGVAANDKLRRQFKIQSRKLKVKFLVPPKDLCTDNAVMVAITAHYHWLKGKIKVWKKIEANANLRIG